MGEPMVQSYAKPGRQARPYKGNAMHVYAIEAPHGVKVGISANPTGRIRGLETIGGFSASRVWVSTKTDIAEEIERAVHKEMRASRQIGEWFSVDFEAAVRCVSDRMRESRPIRDPRFMWGVRFKQARLSANKTQLETASVMKVTRGAISQW